jgi:glutamate/tyrosine decarboxylase-like PLP-dependent enzyme
VCLRWLPARVRGAQQEDADIAGRLDALNAALLARLDRSGEVLLSQTRVDERLVLRVAIGNLRTERRHVTRAWDLIREHGRELAREHDLA